MRVLGILGGGVIAAILATTAAPIHAQDFDARSGQYESEAGQNLSLLLEPVGEDRYAISISTTVPMKGELPGCGGSVTGEVLIENDGASLQVPNEGFIDSEPVSEANQEICRIDLSFVDEHTIRMQEVSGCGYFHGAGCSFTGDVIHEASGI